MDKTRKKSILQIIRITLIIIGLAIYFTNIDRLHWGFLFGALIVPIIIEGILNLIIPEKQTKKKTTKNKNTVSNTRTIKNNKTASNINIPKNLIRSKKEMLTLPIEQISWREFEEVCYLYFKAKGCNPRKTSEGADGGIDLIIYSKKDQTDEAVQIKHYINSGNQIDVKIIRELDSAKKNHHCTLARLITSSTITNPAMVEAGDRHIETNSIEWVRSTLDPWREKEAKKLNYI